MSPETLETNFTKRGRGKVGRKSHIFRSVKPTLQTMEERFVPAGTVTGTVFQDYNGDGIFSTDGSIENDGTGTVGTAVDEGIGGVTVTAFDAADVVQGTATTNADGTYELNVGGEGPYRVEFTNLPQDFVTGNHGPQALTAVQFIGDGNSDNVNLALIEPVDFSVSNPNLVTVCYVFGDQVGGPNADEPVIISFPYSSGSTDFANITDPADHALAVPAREVGTVWGLAFNRATESVYASAYMKKHAGFGPDGVAAVYQMGTTGTTADLLVNLEDVFGVGVAGTDPHDTTDDPNDFLDGFVSDNFNESWDAVGKISFGGLDTDDAGTRVFVMNLNDRSLYSIPTSGPLDDTTIERFQVPRPASATGGGDLGDVRPFAVEYHDGLVYVGMVNSAESTQNPGDLRAYVYTFDPQTGTFSDQPVLEEPLAYDRGVATIDPVSGTGFSADWQAWSPTFQTLQNANLNGLRLIYPQPMLTGLTFDTDGNMVLGIRDRAGDQSGPANPADPDNPDLLYLGISAGDTLRAEINTPGSPGDGFTLENNGAVGGRVSQGADNNQGPGGGEFYFDDDRPTFGGANAPSFHDELSLGAVLQVPGYPDVVTSVYNPGLSTPLSSGGFRWFDNTEGDFTKAYQIYADNPDNSNLSVFEKAAGIGDLIYIPGNAVEIGNRLFLDIDEDGKQDANDRGLAGVTVELLQGDTVIATAVTNGDGEYFFSSAGTAASSTPAEQFGLPLEPDTEYTIRFRKDIPGTDGLTTSNAAGVPDDLDSDAVMDGEFAIIPARTSAIGGDHTFDAGLIPGVFMLGDRVFVDDNNNGMDDGEPPVPGATVNLYTDNDDDGVPDGPAIQTATTDPTGFYLFDNLTLQNYLVEVVLPGEFVSSTGPNGEFEPAPDPDDDDQNGKDKGTLFDRDPDGDTVIRAATFTLDQNRFDIDFGVIPTLSLGNLVFSDINNDGIFDDAIESGIPNVAVRLFDTQGNEIDSTTTDADGNYLFTGLLPGDYVVEVVRPGGFIGSSTGGVGANFFFEPAPDADDLVLDNDDNGTEDAVSGFIRSAPVTLDFADEPTFEDGDPNSNLTVDFGLIPEVALGNLVFSDDNNNGVRDSGEAGVPNVPVRLLDADGNEIDSTTTDADGNYLFTGLEGGDYVVEIMQPPGLDGSSTGGGSEPAGDPDDDTDNNDDGTEQGLNVIRSGVVTVISGQEPTDDGDDDPDTNLTVDFGLIPTPQPILSLGNLVFSDDNNDGVFDDAVEEGIAGVTVRLFGPQGNLIGSQTTDANGNYLFTGLPAGDYTVEVVTPSGFSGSSTGGPAASFFFEPAPDPDDLDLDNDDNGTEDGGVIRSLPVTLTLGGEPTFEDGDPNSNLTVDFGLIPEADEPVLLSVGDLVFSDDNNNGVRDAGESGVPSVAVRLLDSDGNEIAATTTDTDGNYLFEELPAGDYFVEIDLPLGFDGSSTGGGSEPAGDPDDDVNDSDDGTEQGGGVIRSGAVTLTAGGEPDGNGNANLTIDFGLIPSPEPTLTLGNFVFLDADNNGVFGTGDSAFPGVPVRLIRNGSVIASAVTDDGGEYLFTGLPEGNYVVEVDIPDGFNSSTGGTGEPASDPDNNINNDDNGTQDGRVARATPITLSLGDEPDGNTNLTVDFGLIPTLSLGNQVFQDDDNDGVFDSGEDPIAGVTVRLIRAGEVIATTTTDADGRYLFDDLPPGTYVVETDVPGGFVSSTGNGTTAPDPDDNTDDDDNGTQVGDVARSAPVTLTVGGEPVDDGDGNPNTNLTVDFGFTEEPTPPTLGSVSGFVYEDLNINALREPDQGERPIPNTRITLTGTTADGEAINRVTTTDANGFYEFLELPAGDYTIIETQPGGLYYDGLDLIGSQGGTTGNDVLTLTLGEGENGINNNFGEIPPASVFGYVYVDLNQDGSFTPGEPGIPDVAITVSGTAFPGSPLERPLAAADLPGGFTVQTNSQGFWEFPLLPPGVYQTVEAQPEDFLDGLEEDADPSPTAGTVVGNDIFASVALPVREIRGPLNYGEVLPAGGTIGGNPQLPLGPLAPSKQFFLASSPTLVGGALVPAAPIEPEATGLIGEAVDVPLNPRFEVTTGDAADPTYIAAAGGAGLNSTVRVFDYSAGTERFRLQAFPGFDGGVRLAKGDVTGDGVDDIVTAPGAGGGPRIQVFDGVTGEVVANYFAFESTFRDGLFVAVGDTDGDGFGDIIVGADTGGGPRVTVFSGADGSTLQDFFVYEPEFRGGVRVAAGDLDGDGFAEIITGAGVGGGPRVTVIDGRTLEFEQDFFVFETGVNTGLYVAAGDLDADGDDDIIVGTEAGVAGRVRAVDGLNPTQEIGNFFAYAPTLTTGVRVSTADVDGDGVAEIVTAPGVGGTAQIRVVSPDGATELDGFWAFDATFLGGAFVA